MTRDRVFAARRSWSWSRRGVVAWMTVCSALCVPKTAIAGEFQDAVVIGPGARPSIAVNDDGVAVAVWERPGRAPGQLQAATRSAAGRWSRPRTIGKTGSTLVRRAARLDVAIDRRGNVVVIWAQVTNAAPRREVVLTARLRSGRSWSGPHILATVTSPREDMTVAPEGSLKPSLELDRHGNAVALWTRLASTVEGGFVVETATMRASGRWSKPRMLGDNDGRVALDVAETGEAMAAWITPSDAGTLPAVVAATRPRGGPWSQPEVVSAEQWQQSPPDATYGRAHLSHPSVVLAENGRATVSWKRISRVKPGLRGRHRQVLQVASRTAGGQWSGPATLDEQVDDFAPVFLTMRRDEVNALWLRDVPTRDSDVREFRAASRNAQGVWSFAPRAIARALILQLKDVAVSASGHMVAVVERGILIGGPQGEFRTRLEAYVRTPDHVWSEAQALSRPATDTGDWCEGGHVALSRSGRGMTAWSCLLGGGRFSKVITTSFTPTPADRTFG